MKKTYLSFALFAAAVLLAAFQLIKFDTVIAHTSGWTDGQADSWTVFSPAIDGIILLIIVVFTSLGTYVGLSRLKRLRLRILLALLVAFTTWSVFFTIQLVIQHHLSHFNGV